MRKDCYFIAIIISLIFIFMRGGCNCSKQYMTAGLTTSGHNLYGNYLLGSYDPTDYGGSFTRSP